MEEHGHHPDDGNGPCYGRFDSGMDFRLLGPLEVVERDRPLKLGGLKQRSLLAILLLEANELVSTDRLIDKLWGATPPATCAKSIQVYVSRLRKQLGNSRLATHAPGYMLRVEASELDLARFEQLADEARRADARAAARKLRDALALWRGPPLADLTYEPFAQPEIARLEELRMAVLEQRMDADLAVGRHAELVGELEALIVRNPLRERLRFLLMLALYRSARQAEALDAYRAARRELSEELGLEPSEELKRLERSVLRQDPALDLAAGAPREGPRAEVRVPERALLIVPRALPGLDPLLRLAEPLAASASPHELIVAGVVPAAELAAATAALAERRDQLLADGLAARTAAFSSPRRGEDIVRLTGQENVDLLLMDAGASPLDGDARVVLEQAPCDVALLAEAGGSLGDGPVVVPFGAGAHDWAALRLAAWVARATDAPLRLIGSAADSGEEGRDASRLLADASLIVQRTAGIVAEPLLASPGRRGVAALAEGAGLLVVGLSERWRREGLGRARGELAMAPPAPTVFVRRGRRADGLVPPETRTPFSWSLTGSPR
jgi:DNA-binding SARP family transcriptional activator